MRLFDTDIVIDAMADVSMATDRLVRAEIEGELGISSVSKMELIAGCQSKGELVILTRFLRRFAIVQIVPGASIRAVRLMEEYRLSHGLLMPDALIAATALEHEYRLVSKNQKDFRFIPKLLLEPYP